MSNVAVTCHHDQCQGLHAQLTGMLEGFVSGSEVNFSIQRKPTIEYILLINKAFNGSLQLVVCLTSSQSALV